MTTQKAIEAITDFREMAHGHAVLAEALDMAIKALSNTPNTLEMLDCVEKEYAIKVIQEMKHPLAMVTVKAIQKIRNSNTCENTCDFKRMSHAKDTIYRQDAIDVAKQHWYKPDIAKALEELPSAQPDNECEKCVFAPFKQFRQTAQPEHDGWIPTRIAKPPKAGQYLVTKQQKTGACQIATAHYNPSFDEWSGNGNFKKILAWQPLPSPYTQE